MGTIEIPNGSVATYVGVWSFSILAGSTQLASTVIANVGQELGFDGLTINNYDAGNLNFFWDGNLSVTLQILNQSGQELDDSDLNAQVADAVATLNGQVVSANVSAVTGPDSGTNTGTGATHATPSGSAAASLAPPAASGTHQCGDPTWSCWQDIGQCIQCASTKLLTTAGLLFVGLIVGIILIVAVEEKTKMGA